MVQPSPAPSPRLFKVIAAYLAVYVIWGSTYLGIRIAIETLPIFFMPGLRFLVAGLLLYGCSRWRGAARPKASHWRDAAVVGAMLLYVANGLVVWAETRVSSGLTALLIAIVPLCMVLLDWLRPGGNRPTLLVVVGILLGLAGIGVLTGPNELAGGRRVDLLGAAGLVVASFSWCGGSLYSRSAAKPASPYLAASMQMIAGGVLHLATSGLTGEWTRLDFGSISPASLGALAYLIFFGSIVAFTAYMWLMQVSSPARVATYAYVNPIVAILLGWLFAGEEVNLRVFIAAAIIVAAVAFITTAQGTKGVARQVDSQTDEPAREPDVSKSSPCELPSPTCKPATAESLCGRTDA